MRALHAYRPTASTALTCLACGYLTSVALLNPVTMAASPAADSFGKTQDGVSVESYTLKNDLGMQATIITRGATLQSLIVPDRDGNLTDVILGFDNVSGYESEANQYFGATVGRVANRIAEGKFTLDGKQYSLATNNDVNHLHGGGPRSFDKVVWSADSFESEAGQGVTCTYTSPDGEEGYPGTLTIKVTFTLSKTANDLTIRYEASTDAATPINVSNHAYFNLSGAGSETVLDHELKLFASNYTPVDDTLIPTGEIASVENTALDFREFKKIGRDIEPLVETSTLGYDHNFVLDTQVTTREAEAMRFAAILRDPSSGRVMTVKTTEPGVQFYSGNFLMNQVGKAGRPYAHQSAICLETQHFPDSVNHENFPSTILRPSERFTSKSLYSFSTEK